ncbi:MAG: hypothetical protein RLY30_1815 [Pseudomonadota bacterium]
MTFLSRLPPRWQALVLRVGFNLFPPFRGTGGRLTWVAPDLLSMEATLPFNWRTRNANGTIYGGSLFAVTDGPHPIMLLIALGPKRVVVWDKAASIRYRRPATRALRAKFEIPQALLQEIQHRLQADEAIEHVFTIDLVDADQQVYATVDRTVYIATRDYERRRRSMHASAVA